MSLSTYESAAYAWLVAAVNDATKEVVFADDSGSGTTRRTPPQPAEPFVSLRTTSLVSTGAPASDPSADAIGERSIYERYQAAISCQFIGNGSRELCIACKRALATSDVLSTFAASDVGVLRSTDMLSIPEVRDGLWRQRWQFDLFLDVPDSMTEEVGYFEHVELTMTIEDATGATAVSRSFTVDA